MEILYTDYADFIEEPSTFAYGTVALFDQYDLEAEAAAANDAMFENLYPNIA